MSGKSLSDDAKARREVLLKIYDAAINEYRFNVQLGWDRTKFFIGLSVTAIGAGIGLLRLADTSALISLFLCFFFALLIPVTLFGWLAAEKSKKYSREAVLTKTLIERELGLWHQIPDLGDPDLTLALAVTPGQRNFRKVVFSREERREKPSDAGSALKRIEWIFGVLMGVECLGVLFCWLSFCQRISLP